LPKLRRRLGHFEFKTLFCTPQAVRFQGRPYEIIRPVYVRNRYKSQAGAVVLSFFFSSYDTEVLPIFDRAFFSR
jgi:hypothetical protein